MAGAAHRDAGRAVEGRPVEDGSWTDDEAEHDEAVDNKVLQRIPPATDYHGSY